MDIFVDDDACSRKDDGAICSIPRTNGPFYTSPRELEPALPLLLGCSPIESNPTQKSIPSHIKIPVGVMVTSGLSRRTGYSD